MANFELAPFPSRALAAIVDWIALCGLFVSFARFFPNPDWTFLITLGFGLCYFTLCHTAFTGGQTLGKRAFGLRVVSLRPEGGAFLSPLRSGLRYAAFFGLILLLQDVPPLYYRMRGTVAPIELLELPMLIVFVCIGANIVALLFDIQFRTLYDRAAGSIVLRSPSGFDAGSYAGVPLPNRIPFMNRPAGYIGIGMMLGAAIWFFSLTTPPDLAPVIEARYALERDYPVRVVSVGFKDEDLEVELIALANDNRQALLTGLTDRILERSPVLRTKLKGVRYRLFPASKGEIEEYRAAFDSPGGVVKSVL